jgi:hypothetical protein
MTRVSIGFVACAAVIAGAVVGTATVFGEKTFSALGLPYHFMNFAVLTVILVVLGIGCGVRSWVTRPGKVAAIGGAVLGLAFIGLVVLVLIAFSNPGG